MPHFKDLPQEIKDDIFLDCIHYVKLDFPESPGDPTRHEDLHFLSDQFGICTRAVQDHDSNMQLLLLTWPMLCPHDQTKAMAIYEAIAQTIRELWRFIFDQTEIHRKDVATQLGGIGVTDPITWKRVDLGSDVMDVLLSYLDQVSGELRKTRDARKTDLEFTQELCGPLRPFNIWPEGERPELPIVQHFFREATGCSATKSHRVRICAQLVSSMLEEEHEHEW